MSRSFRNRGIGHGTAYNGTQFLSFGGRLVSHFSQWASTERSLFKAKRVASVYYEFIDAGKFTLFECLQVGPGDQ